MTYETLSGAFPSTFLDKTSLLPAPLGQNLLALTAPRRRPALGTCPRDRGIERWTYLGMVGMLQSRVRHRTRPARSQRACTRGSAIPTRG
jgi:hypothetical protein